MMRLWLVLLLTCALRGGLAAQGFAPGAEIEVDLSGTGRWVLATVVRTDGASVIFRLKGVAALRKTSATNVRLPESAPEVAQPEAEDPRSPLFLEWRLFAPKPRTSDGDPAALDPGGVDFEEPAGTLLVGPDGAYTWQLPSILGPGDLTQGQWYDAKPEEMGGRKGIGLILDEANGGPVWLLCLDQPAQAAEGPQPAQGARVCLESQEETKHVLVGVRPADVPARPDPDGKPAEAAVDEDEAEDAPPILIGVWVLGDPKQGPDDRSAGELSVESSGSYLWAKNLEDMATWTSGTWRPAEEADLGGVSGTGIVLTKAEALSDFLLLAGPEARRTRIIDMKTGEARLHGTLDD